MERWLFQCVENRKVCNAWAWLRSKWNDFVFSVAFTRRQIIIVINFCFCTVFFLFAVHVHYSLRNSIAHERAKNSISMLEYVESICERGAFNFTKHSVFVSGLFQSSNDCNRMKKKSQCTSSMCWNLMKKKSIVFWLPSQIWLDQCLLFTLSQRHTIRRRQITWFGAESVKLNETKKKRSRKKIIDSSEN